MKYLRIYLVTGLCPVMLGRFEALPRHLIVCCANNSFSFKKNADHQAPEAQLKIAYAYSRSGDGKKAMESLKALLKKYPQSPAAGMVRQGKTIFRLEDADQ